MLIQYEEAPNSTSLNNCMTCTPDIHGEFITAGLVSYYTVGGNSGNSIFSLHAILSLLAIPEVFYLVMIKLVVGVPVGVFRVMFSFVIIDKFSLTTTTNGYLLTYTGILSAVSWSHLLYGVWLYHLFHFCISVNASIWYSILHETFYI